MIETPRLRLIPWPASALDLPSLGRELGIAVPQGWRPDVTDILPAAPPPFGPYAVVAGEELVGSAGFFGPPDESGTVEIGYEVAPERRRQGYASETAAALVDWAHLPGRRAADHRGAAAREHPVPARARERRLHPHRDARRRAALRDQPGLTNPIRSYIDSSVGAEAARAFSAPSASSRRSSVSSALSSL